MWGGSRPRFLAAWVVFFPFLVFFACLSGLVWLCDTRSVRGYSIHPSPLRRACPQLCVWLRLGDSYNQALISFTCPDLHSCASACVSRGRHEKVLPYVSQRWGFPPVCVRMCLTRSPDVEKALPHA